MIVQIEIMRLYDAPAYMFSWRMFVNKKPPQIFVAVVLKSFKYNVKCAPSELVTFVIKVYIFCTLIECLKISIIFQCKMKR